LFGAPILLEILPTEILAHGSEDPAQGCPEQHSLQLLEASQKPIPEEGPNVLTLKENAK
jgi:hypothetical protein